MSYAEKVIFDFNLANKSGLQEVFFAKGAFFSVIAILTLLALALVFVVIPWELTIQGIALRVFFLLFLVLAFCQYSKAIIKVSFDDDNVRVTAWKKENLFPIENIIWIKTTYEASSGTVRMKIKQKNRSNSYLLWAPSNERERYQLFLKMQEYIKSRGLDK